MFFTKLELTLTQCIRIFNAPVQEVTLECPPNYQDAIPDLLRLPLPILLNQMPHTLPILQYPPPPVSWFTMAPVRYWHVEVIDMSRLDSPHYTLGVISQFATAYNLRKLCFTPSQSTLSRMSWIHLRQSDTRYDHCNLPACLGLFFHVISLYAIAVIFDVHLSL